MRGAEAAGVVPRDHVLGSQLPRTGSHFWPLGFPLLECGPTGPRARAQVEGAILTNKR
jgi:hypothetical protein